MACQPFPQSSIGTAWFPIPEMGSTRKRPPLRYQLSEYDCVPTTIGNAIAHLFEREDIPPEVVQRLYLYSLDAVGRRGTFARGSSEESVRLLAGWLEQFSAGRFRIRTEYLAGREVHLGRGNRIVECLNDGGVALYRQIGHSVSAERVGPHIDLDHLLPRLEERRSAEEQVAVEPRAASRPWRISDTRNRND